MEDPNYYLRQEKDKLHYEIGELQEAVRLLKATLEKTVHQRDELVTLVFYLREVARKNKNFDFADSLRDILKEIDIEVQDMRV